MPLVAKVLASIALIWGALEVSGRWFIRIERRHFPYRDRMRAEKIAGGLTTWVVALILLTSVWSQ